jgi:hypothetical protein
MTRQVYDSSSPYYGTPQTNWYLAPIKYRDIPPHASDRYVVIDAMYEFRPDNLSTTLYNNPKYWWIFMARNIDVIRDPIWDLKSGIFIYVPTLDRLQQLIG